MKPKLFIKSNEVIYQYIFYQYIAHLFNFALFTFYYIELYRRTESLKVFMLDRVVMYLGLWIGFTIFSFLIDRLGYLKAFRISFFMQAICMLSVIAFFPRLEDFYILLACFRGLTRGTFWPINNAILLSEVTTKDRSKVINIVFAILRTEEIMFPALFGAMILYTGDLRGVLALVFAVYIFAAFAPWKTNKKTDSKISSKEFTALMSKKGFKNFSLLTFVDDLIVQFTGAIFIIVAYEIIGDTFKYGILASLVGVSAALASLFELKIKDKFKERLAYIGFGLNFTITTLFAFIWNLPMLAVRELTAPFIHSISMSYQETIDYKIKEKLTGNLGRESTIEINLIAETIRMISRVSIFSFFYILLVYNLIADDALIRIAVVLLTFFKLITYIMALRLDRRLRR